MRLTSTSPTSSEDPDVWATITQRDGQLWHEEVAELFVDADSDGRGYVEIEVNPLGTVLDLFVLNREGTLRILYDWDSPGLQVGVTVDGTVDDRTDRDRGWTVELAVPFADFFTAPHIPPEPGDRWRANLYRIERAGDEMAFIAWSPTGVPNYHVPARFGTLVFRE